MNSIHLDTPAQYLKLVGPLMGKRLKKLGIETIDDLLHHIPFRYEDFRFAQTIDKLKENEMLTVKGKVAEIKNIYTKTGKKIQEAIVSDGTGTLKVTWYNQPFLLNSIKKDSFLSLSGKIKRFGNKLFMDSPSYELIKLSTDNSQLSTIHTGRLVPIYPETEGISSKWLRSRIFAALTALHSEIIEFLPQSIIDKYAFFKESDALWQIHFPATDKHAQKAYERLSFDELFLIQLSSLKTKSERKKDKVGYKFKVERYYQNLKTFIETLPFILTNAQKTAVEDILKDLKQENPMNRLLQGEVGSGKTVVAAIAMYLSFLNGLRSVLMAPTEILANQHYQTLIKLLHPVGLKVGLFTKKQKEFDTPIIVGTHALLSEKLAFGNLGLVVIDEQQRFGVTQRALLRQKGINPHLLTMTATPIPRTMALTLYGELDVSYIDELPKVRKRVKTWVVPNHKRKAAYDWIISKLRETRSQTYIICPFIEESESLNTVKAAKIEYEKLKNDIFPMFKVYLLHGRQKSEEREKVLSQFNQNKIDILVATPIVEVGIDVPNATIALIEGADRFGLTQLHQLRGRVGRGEKQGFCLLFTESDNIQSIQRLKVLETNYIGSRIAEIDLRLRGPGTMHGTRQHGFTDSRLKVANLSDPILWEKAKKEAESTFRESNSALKTASPLKNALKKYTIEMVSTD